MPSINYPEPRGEQLWDEDGRGVSQAPDLRSVIQKLNIWFSTADRSAHSWAELNVLMDELNRAFEKERWKI